MMSFKKKIAIVITVSNIAYSNTMCYSQSNPSNKGKVETLVLKELKAKYEKNDPSSIHQLAKEYMGTIWDSDSQINYAEALKQLEKLKKNHPEYFTQNALFDFYKIHTFGGYGVDKNIEQSSEVASLLPNISANSLEIPKNINLSDLGTLKVNAENGDIESQFLYGIALLELNLSYHEGIHWINQAKEKGHVDATFCHEKYMSKHKNNLNQSQKFDIKKTALKYKNESAFAMLTYLNMASNEDIAEVRNLVEESSHYFTEVRLKALYHAQKILSDSTKLACILQIQELRKEVNLNHSIPESELLKFDEIELKMRSLDGLRDLCMSFPLTNIKIPTHFENEFMIHTTLKELNKTAAWAPFIKLYKEELKKEIFVLISKKSIVDVLSTAILLQDDFEEALPLVITRLKEIIDEVEGFESLKYSEICDVFFTDQKSLDISFRELIKAKSIQILRKIDNPVSLRLNLDQIYSSNYLKECLLPDINKEIENALLKCGGADYRNLLFDQYFYEIRTLKSTSDLNKFKSFLENNSLQDSLKGMLLTEIEKKNLFLEYQSIDSIDALLQTTHTTEVKEGVILSLFENYWQTKNLISIAEVKDEISVINSDVRYSIELKNTLIKSLLNGYLDQIYSKKSISNLFQVYSENKVVFTSIDSLSDLFEPRIRYEIENYKFNSFEQAKEDYKRISLFSFFAPSVIQSLEVTFKNKITSFFSDNNSVEILKKYIQQSGNEADWLLVDAENTILNNSNNQEERINTFAKDIAGNNTYFYLCERNPSDFQVNDATRKFEKNSKDAKTSYLKVSEIHTEGHSVIFNSYVEVIENKNSTEIIIYFTENKGYSWKAKRNEYISYSFQKDKRIMSVTYETKKKPSVDDAFLELSTRLSPSNQTVDYIKTAIQHFILNFGDKL